MSTKKYIANTLLGFGRQQEVQSFKKDAANLLVNRIQKKLRETFSVIVEFALFQEVSNIFSFILIGVTSHGQV